MGAEGGGGKKKEKKKKKKGTRAGVLAKEGGKEKLTMRGTDPFSISRGFRMGKKKGGGNSEN